MTRAELKSIIRNAGSPESELVRIGNQLWSKDSIIAGVDYIFDKAIYVQGGIDEFSQPEKIFFELIEAEFGDEK